MPNVIELNGAVPAGAEVYYDLKGAGVRGSQSPLAGLFIAESPNVIKAALEAGYEPVSILAGRKQLGGSAAEVISMCGDIPVFTGDDAKLESLAGYRLTRGVLCAMRRKALPAPTAVLKEARRAAVLMGIVDPTNVGSIFRSAAALGADAVLLDATCCDPLHRRAARVSMGSVFKVPWTRLTGDPHESGLAVLRDSGFYTAALALREGAVSISSPALAEKERLALVLGTEGHGLEDSVIDECDMTVIIPMANGMDSLNVGAAAAVAFWQLCGGRG